MFLLSAWMRRDNAPDMVDLDRVTLEDDAVPVRHKAMLILLARNANVAAIML